MSQVIECQCEVCVKACSHRPGWFLPGQIEDVAKFLNMELKDFFDKYLSIEWWSGKESGGKDIFVIAPAVVGYEGEMAPCDPRGRCTFLTKDNLCQIHPVKPFECAVYHHDMASDVGKNLHKELAVSWIRFHQQVVELWGGEPEAREPESFLDMWPVGMTM
ncbi:hypothetical protein E2P64_06505 [Candidatus Bathyarchaeota archaeon]|nr:hypothetical protein E2P64_06505 [Candidatus Bathyarchaeota archaeon]